MTERLWISDGPTGFQFRPRNYLLDGDFNLLPVYGILQESRQGVNT